MKDELIKIKNGKERVEDARKNLAIYFEKKFPNVIGKDINKIEDDINKNLQILLCSSLKYKTSKIVIDKDEKNNYYGNTVVLSRKGCLYYPRRDYGIDLFQNEKQNSEIDKNYNLIYTNNLYDQNRVGEVFVKLSILKDHKLIDQEKFISVIDLREEAIKNQKDSKIVWTRRHSKDESSMIKITDNFCLRFFSNNVDFEIIDGTDKSYGSISHNNLEQLNNIGLDIIFENWNKINKELLDVELIKDKTIKGYIKILKNLEDKNRAFLVLESLTKKI